MGTYRGCGTFCRYLDRRAERFVIEAYRRWTFGGESGSLRNYERTADYFADELGPEEGPRLFLAFVGWLSAISAFREAPALSSPVECPLLCRDECMMLAMLASAQSEDRESIEVATSRLVDIEGIDDSIRAARRFAEKLSGCGHHLLPVPAAVVRDIAERPSRQAFH